MRLANRRRCANAGTTKRGSWPGPVCAKERATTTRSPARRRARRDGREMHDGVVRQVHALPDREVVRDLERQPAHRAALRGGEPVVPLRLRRADGPIYLATVVQQAADEPTPDEAVGPGDQ